MDPITAADLDRFRRTGWWHRPEGIAPADELPRLAAIYDRLFATASGRAEGRHFALFGDEAQAGQPLVPQILGPELDAPELTRTDTWANAIVVLTALLGAPPDQMTSHAICKPPRCPLATPWHQDEAYWNPKAYHHSLSVWIPLQPVDTRTGCMHFIPGSHLGDILPHRPPGDDDRAQGLELEPGPWDLSNQVAVPLAAGGCTAHGGRMLHYTTPNQADVPRRAWIITGGLDLPQRRIPAVHPWAERLRRARERAAQAMMT
jgi:hypothetical protein